MVLALSVVTLTGAADAAAAPQKVTLFKQVATPNVKGHPTVYLDCSSGLKCKGTVTLLTANKKRTVIGSGKIEKHVVGPAISQIKLNTLGRKLNKQAKRTVIARAKVGKRTAERAIGLRRSQGACSIVTRAEAAAIVGEPVNPGREHKSSPNPAGRLCTFASVRDPLGISLEVGLDRGSAGGFSRFTLLEVLYDSPGELTPVSGVGDRAYFLNTRASPMQALHTVKGDAYLSLLGPGTLARNRRLDLQVPVAKNALKRLDK